MHDQVRTERRQGAAGFVGGPLEVFVHIDQPTVELFNGAAVGSRERADDAGAASRFHQRRTGDQEDRRGDQRQAQAALQEDGQRHECRLPQRTTARSTIPTVTSIAAAIRRGPKPSFSTIVPRTAPKITLVSRSADTGPSGKLLAATR